MRRAGLVLCLLLAAAAIVAGGVAFWGYRVFENPGQLHTETRVLIDRGAGLRKIARTLAQAEVISHPQLFVAMARFKGQHNDLKAGEYRFAPLISPAEVLEILRSGRVVIRRVTIPEGLTSSQVVSVLARAEGLMGDLSATPAEGSLMPDTYDYVWGDTKITMVERMSRAHRKTLQALWQNRQSELPIQNQEEAVILASIVEKETGAAAERAHIAAVFHNRLRRGMRLQSDPTVVYALTGGSGALGRPLSRADLALDHPYNTYRIAGLPPGPISNPGTAAIVAVLNPLASQDLYFVADGKGGHAFARTLREHNRNVARWRRLQRANKTRSSAPER